MNELNNISEYQKIIFANGLDEDNLNYQDGIQALSNKYPFVVFITKKSDKSGIDGGASYEIDNIWFEGIRLTRFIGIDNTHNTLVVGDHTLKLKYDPNSGLIGLYDENELSSLTIHKILWSTYEAQTENTSISSFDNKFSIIFRYTLKENSSANANVENINKALSYIPNEYFDKISEMTVNTISNNIQYYKFVYKIKKPCYSYQDFSFISNYATDKSCSTRLKLFLHPESYIIDIKDESNNNVSLYGTNISLERNKEYSFTLTFDPLVDSNQLYHKLYLEASIDNNAFILDKNSIEIKQGIAQFKLSIPDVIPNNSINSALSLKVKYVLVESGSDGYYSNLKKNITINVNGETTDKFFYFGYSNPKLDTTKLVDYSSVDVGNYVWKDEEIENNYPDSWYSNKYFYCAIPVTYPDVLPRWGGYYHETTNEADCVNSIDNIPSINHSIPLDCTDWFTIESSRYTRNGIDFKIYKRKEKGKFYGFVK